MKLMLQTSLLITALLVTVGCTTVLDDPGNVAHGEPGWLLNPPASGGVIYGVGGSAVTGNKAEALQSARTAATVNLMANLRVQIRAEQQSTTRLDSQGDLSEEFTRDIVSVVPELELNDTRLVDSWESPDGQLYALVSFDRAAAAQRVLERFRQSREMLAPPSAADNDLWTIYKNWEQTLSQVEELTATYELYSILTSGKIASASWAGTRQTLIEDYRRFLERIVLQVKALDEVSSAYQNLAQQYFSRLGPAIMNAMAPPDSQPVWTVSYRVTADHQTQKNRHYQFVTVEARLLDEEDRERRQASDTRRGIATSEEEALRRGAEDAFSTVADNLIR